KGGQVDDIVRRLCPCRGLEWHPCLPIRKRPQRLLGDAIDHVSTHHPEGTVDEAPCLPQEPPQDASGGILACEGRKGPCEPGKGGFIERGGRRGNESPNTA